jgi:hypothetical protein
VIKVQVDSIRREFQKLTIIFLGLIKQFRKGSSRHSPTKRPLNPPQFNNTNTQIWESILNEDLQQFYMEQEVLLQIVLNIVQFINIRVSRQHLKS